MSFILDDRHDFCICCSGLILFFVRSDVELHPDSESIPLLIDRVSISIALIFHLFLRRDYWHHTQSKFKFTDILSRRVWKTIDFCHLVAQSELWSVSFWVFWWRHCFLKRNMVLSWCCYLSAENTFRQLWTNFLRFLDRCQRTKDQADHVSSTYRQSLSCVHKYCTCKLKAQRRKGLWNTDFN